MFLILGQALEFGRLNLRINILPVISRGTDLSPIQPDQVPSNVRFVIDDAEEQWAFNQKFDYVHVRVMIISIRDWPRFIGLGFECGPSSE
jgi:hypothetical protein